MKRIITSLGMLLFVAAVVAGGTGAFFSDTETSTGNVFTAGAIDLKVDSQQHYNNAICVEGKWALEQGAQVTVPQYPVIGDPCEGTWLETDLGVESPKFFRFNDIKPGDSGENTISLHVINNDAWMCASVSNLTSDDVSQTEPEQSAPLDVDDMLSGELDDTMIWTVWKDDGDNILEPGEPVLTTGTPVNGVLPLYDSTTGPALVGNSVAYIGVKWELPASVGNEVQTDRLTGDISFQVIQARNNPNFTCIPRVASPI